jgi:hypothetical protein
MNNLLYICFNRFDLVQKTLPPLLELDWDNIVILCDGSRNETDQLAIEEIRYFINERFASRSLNLVYRMTNMGCRRNIEDGLNFFFREFGVGWVFEDDILLTKPECFKEIRSAQLFGHVSLYNHVPCLNYNWIPVSNGQYFIWGWYLNVDRPIDFKLVPSFSLLVKLVRIRGFNRGTRLFVTFVRTLLNKVDTWDSIYRCWAIYNDVNNSVVGLSVVQNIGFDERATHTSTAVVVPFAEKEYQSIEDWNREASKRNPTYLA